MPVIASDPAFGALDEPSQMLLLEANWLSAAARDVRVLRSFLQQLSLEALRLLNTHLRRDAAAGGGAMDEAAGGEEDVSAEDAVCRGHTMGGVVAEGAVDVVRS